MMEEIVWVEKYRPRTVKDTILPKGLKSMFLKFLKDREFPHLLLTGGPGVGKTTVARALLDELDCDYLLINSSMKGIDTLRTDILSFASTISFKGGRKFVILDEADGLTHATQHALRAFMEEFSSNCGFILTCNFKSKIIEPLHSRCATISFAIPRDERAELMIQTYKSIINILKAEKVEFVDEAVLGFVRKYFPDNRRILNELQAYYQQNGRVDSGLLATIADTSVKALVGFMKENDFTAVRKWVAENSDIESHVIFRRLYDTATTYCKPKGIAQLVLILAKYQYQDAFVIDKEINLVACLTEIMIHVEFDKK